MKKRLLLCLFFFLFGSHLSASTKQSIQQEKQHLIQTLGWKHDDNPCYRCHGYFVDDFKPASSSFRGPIDISSTQPSTLLSSGEILLNGDVKLKQSERTINAEQLKLQRNHKTGKIYKAELKGNLKWIEHNRAFYADNGEIDFTKRFFRLSGVIYRMLATSVNKFNSYIWGTATQIESNKPHTVEMQNATYSTCSPENCHWKLKAKRIVVDQNKGYGYLTHGWLIVHNFPIFYLPYHSFSLDNQRKSGFLTPYIAYSTLHGLEAILPFYLNLAPNYDTLFTARFLSKNGMLLQNRWRYLTEKAHGNFEIEQIFYDREFRKFVDNNSKNSSSIDPVAYRNLTKRYNVRNGRGAILVDHHQQLTPNWSADLHVNCVSDDYFVRDFRTLSRNRDTDQLENHFEVIYEAPDFQFKGSLSGIQTLHLIDRLPAEDQYLRLPELNFTKWYSHRNFTSETKFSSINFYYPWSKWYNRPAHLGTVRTSLRQVLAFPFYYNGITTTPIIEVNAANYSTYRKNLETPPNKTNLTYVHPIIAVDQKISVHRGIKILGNNFTQIVEPHFLYLYVPTLKQNNVPLFDTYLPTFDYDQLFRRNRFVGSDRVGDAHQLTIACTSRLLDSTGHEYLTAELGGIFSFKKHQIAITEQNWTTSDRFNYDPLTSENVSPIAGKLLVHLGPYITGTLKISWDQNYHRFNSSDISLDFVKDKYIASLSYLYAYRGDQHPFNHRIIDLNRIEFSLILPINSQWKLFSSIAYNYGYRRLQNYLSGLEYEDCCWRVRLIASREFLPKQTRTDNYDTRYYLQLSFKGFDTINFGTAESLLRQRIRGFNDADF